MEIVKRYENNPILTKNDVLYHEIVQFYVRDLVGEVTRPVKELKGFRRISLAPGENKRVSFSIPVSELGFHGLDMTYNFH